MLNLFKRKSMTNDMLNTSFGNIGIGNSFIGLNNGFVNDSNSSNSSNSGKSILRLDFIIDYHKHATIL